MTKPLDLRFGKIVARMRSTTFEGERNTARIQAGKVAAQCGMSFEEALRVLDAPPVQPKAANIFDGFDDFMEKREPGWRAKRADEKARRNAAWRTRKAKLLEKYGNMEAAIAPCRREALILNAVSPWRKVRPNRDRAAGWTDSLDGYSNWPQTPPDHIRDAIQSAYPLPITFADAKAEHDYWCARNDELDDLFSEDGEPLGDIALDLAANIRAEMVRDLARTILSTSTLTDLHARFAMMMISESHEPEMVKALFRDLSAMMDTQAQRAAAHPIRPERDGRIEAALRSDPSSTDRHIARSFGCSPTTVGKVRRRLGLMAERRSVHRGGQVYGMGTHQDRVRTP